MMTTFTDRNGIERTIKPHEATFHGSHNRSKSLVLIYLLHRYREKLPGLSAAELSRHTGVKESVISSKASKWCAWGYIDRRASTEGGRLHYSYTIGERGARFVTLRIPLEKRNEYIVLLNAALKRARVT